MGVVNVQDFFMLVNEGRGLVVWEEGSLRPIVLIFYLSCQGLEQKDSLDLISRNGLDSVWRNPWKRLNKLGPNVNRRIMNKNGLRRGKTQGIQF